MPVVSCKQCGAQVSDKHDSCPYCGIKLSEESNSALEGSPSQLINKQVGKHKAPSKTRQGALVGAFIGLLAGIIGAIEFLFVLLPTIVKDLIPLAVAHFPTNPNVANLMTMFFYLFGVAIVPLTVITGCVLGVLFVAVRNKIPGKSTIQKAVVFSMILWALQSIYELRYVLFPPPPEFASLTNTMPLSIRVTLLGLGIVEYLTLGFLFGYLLDRRLRPN